MKLPNFKIGDLVAPLPIVQGGMAIRISTGLLAGSVAACGAIGVIGASGLFLDELRKEIRKAKELAKGGTVAINIMFAAREFLNIVKTAIEEKIDIIFSGAGFSRDIFKLVENTKTLVVPIVSSARLALVAKRSGALGVVVEGKEAGGHLGTDESVEKIVPEVRKAVGPDFKIIGAGGITDGKGIVEMLKLGADAVQLATRFVLSEECNASLAFKRVYQQANKEDIVVFLSPVGLPGRALKTKFMKKVLEKNPPAPETCDFCLKHCSLQFCIMRALENSQSGDVENGIVFSGENVWKIKDRTIKPVREIIDELVKEAEEVYSE